MVKIHQLFGVLLFAAAPPFWAAVRPHPRVEVDESLISRLRLLREQKDPAWTRFARWLETHPAGRSNGNIATGCMLSYLVTGRQQDFDCGWNFVRAKIYRNGADRSAGLMPILDLYQGNRHEAAFQGGVLLAVIAHFYDWAYAGLSPGQRKDLVEWLNATTHFEHLDCPEGGLYMRNDGASVTLGVAAAVYATLGDNPQDQQLQRAMEKDTRDARYYRQGWGQRGRECLRRVADCGRHHHGGQRGLFSRRKRSLRVASFLSAAPAL